MSDTPASPTPFEIELRETLERLGDLSLKLNDRVEEQTKVISHATTMTNEARRAAEATKQQTDPDQYAEYAVEVIDERLEERMKDIRQTASDLLKASSYTREVLSKADQDRTDAQRQLWEREQKLRRFKNRLPWFGCCPSGSCPDGDASSFLSQQRLNVRCPWSLMDHDNHGRRCLCLLLTVSVEMLMVASPG